MDSSNNNSFFHSPITHHSQQPDNPDVNPHSDSNMHDAHHHQTLLGYHDSESDQPWNTSIVRTSLRQAVVELSNHSLKLASKWAAEQLMGLPLITSNSNTPRIMKRESISRSDSFDDIQHDSTTKETSTNIHSIITSPFPPTHAPDYDLILYAKSLLDLGEYERAAHTLSFHSNHGHSNKQNSTSATIFTIGAPPLPNLSKTGIYFRAYALFLAGERRKEEQGVELRNDPLERSRIVNPYLKQLAKEFAKMYNHEDPTAAENDTLDAFGLYVYGIVLKELQKSSTPKSSYFPTPNHPNTSKQQNFDSSSSNMFSHSQNIPSPQSILIQSIIQYPLNWSAWLDLAECCIHHPNVITQVEMELTPISHHWMYHFFLIHVFMEQQQHDQALVIIEKLQSAANTEDPQTHHEQHQQGLFSQCNHLKAMTAVAHYNLRDFDTAQTHFQQLSERDPHRLEQMDIYSNILYVKEAKAALSHLAFSSVRNDKYRPETCVILGNYYSLKGLHEKAVHSFQRALRLDPRCLSAWTLMGHEFVEMKNTAAAIEAYRRAVDINPRDYRAWYGLGQTYEILNMLLYALFYYRKAAALRPYDARMWCAMGGCYLGLDRVDDAMRSYERAVSNHDREGIATQRLATLYREKGEDEKAANCYMRHLNLRMQQQANDKEFSDEDVINLVQVDAQEAEALLYLAFYHRDKGNYDVASKCCLRLLDYPGPEKEEAKALLREIRSRTDFQKDNSDDEDEQGESKRMNMSTSMQFNISIDHEEKSFEFSP